MWQQFTFKQNRSAKAPPTKGLALLGDVLINKFWDLLKINLLLIIGGLGVVTLPATLAASGRIIILMFNHQHYNLYSDFWDYFKRDFWMALLGGAIFSGLILLAAFSGYFYYLYYGNSILGMFGWITALIVGVLACLAMFVYYPLLGYVDLPFGKNFRNSCLLACVEVASSLILVFILGCMILLFGLLWPYSVLAWLIMGFSFSHLLVTFVSYNKIVKYILIKDGTNE